MLRHGVRRIVTTMVLALAMLMLVAQIAFADSVTIRGSEEAVANAVAALEDAGYECEVVPAGNEATCTND